MLKFFLPCNPPRATAQSTTKVFRKPDGSLFLGKDNRGQTTRDELFLLLRPFAPKTPLKGALRVAVAWRFPFNKGAPKKDRLRGVMPCTVRPDCDNLAKLFLDCMTRLRFWDDDAQIYELAFSKIYAEESGIAVEIDNEAPTALTPAFANALQMELSL